MTEEDFTFATIGDLVVIGVICVALALCAVVAISTGAL